MSIRALIGRLCRDTRIGLDLSQQELANALGVSRGYVAHIEHGSANPPLGLVERMGAALGIEFELVGRPPMLEQSPRQRDLVHAWSSGYVARRLRHAGWVTKREVEVVHARHHGWIDLVALHPSTEIMLIIEIKTKLEDVGAIERQLGWYERSAPEVAQRFGWRFTRTAGWLLLLATNEVEDALRLNREVMANAFPGRAATMAELVEGRSMPRTARGLALIDPASKRRAWLVPSRVDGRRSPAPFSGYAEAARRVAR